MRFRNLLCSALYFRVPNGIYEFMSLVMKGNSWRPAVPVPGADPLMFTASMVCTACVPTYPTSACSVSENARWMKKFQLSMYPRFRSFGNVTVPVLGKYVERDGVADGFIMPVETSGKVGVGIPVRKDA